MAYKGMVTVDISMQIPQIDQSVFNELVTYLSGEGFNVRGKWVNTVGYLHVIHTVEDVETRMVGDVVYGDIQTVEIVLEEIVQLRGTLESGRRL